jgi:hypothetical protein
VSTKPYTLVVAVEADSDEAAEELAKRAAASVGADPLRSSAALGNPWDNSIWLDPASVRQHYEDGLDPDELEGAPTYGLTDDQVLEASGNLLFTDYIWSAVWEVLEGELAEVRNSVVESE